ncbi:MAG: glycosyltransferase family 2 protein [Patescibacteria group bacterium]
MILGRQVAAVLPAYNAAKTLVQTVADIPRDAVDDIILVDDCSRDETVALARELGLFTVVHDRNRGYGGNQKTCYATALARGADIVIMVHPDHQYDPRYVTELVTIIAEGRADAAFGSRMLTPGTALKGGMPRWKYLANIALTNVANLVLGLRLSEYHSGFRAYSRKVLQTLALESNSDNFIFDTEIIIQLKHAGFRIREIPIPTRYFKDASSIGFGRSVEYGLHVIMTLWHYVLHRINLRTDPRFACVGSQD